MLNAAPQPGPCDLARAVLGRRPDDAALVRPWAPESAGALWFSRGAFALAALVAWRRRRGDPAPTLWFPDYFCNQSTEPARFAGARIVFYPLGADFAPHWDACRSLARAAPPALLVLVHAFGRPADARDAAAFCRETGARLIEDAAHALRPDGIGGDGDFTLWSPRKTLAIPDGALLVCRNAAEAPRIRDALAAIVPPVPPSAVGWIARRLVQRLLPVALQRARAARRGLPFDCDPPFERLPRTPALSDVARRMLAREIPRLAAIDAIRRRNEQWLRARFAGRSDLAPLFADWPAAWPAPYRFALRAADEATARTAYERLRARGVPVETWPDLAPEVLADPARHAAAIRLRRTVILLPVHQTIDVADLASCEI